MEVAVSTFLKGAMNSFTNLSWVISKAVQFNCSILFKVDMEDIAVNIDNDYYFQP